MTDERQAGLRERAASALYPLFKDLWERGMLTTIEGRSSDFDALAEKYAPDIAGALAVAQVPAQPDHPFKDEWSFQRRMSKGNPEAGKPISPDQPCFICEVPYAEHEPDPTPRPEPLTGTWHCPSCGQQVAPMAVCEVCGVFGLRYERAAFATAPPAEGLAKALAVVIGAHHHAQHSVSTEFMECSQPACALSRAALAQARPSPEETSHD